MHLAMGRIKRVVHSKPNEHGLLEKLRKMDACASECAGSGAWLALGIRPRELNSRPIGHFVRIRQSRQSTESARDSK